MPQQVLKLKPSPKHHDGCNFLLYLPKTYSKSSPKKWPLMLFLHGAGERGDNLNLVKVHGPPKLVDAGEEFPFIIASPQCPDGQIWSIPLLQDLLTHLEKSYSVDPDRIYVTGLSMGGYGTWELAKTSPQRFAAIAPICGGAPFIWGWVLYSLPIWAFHGDADTGVPLSESQRIIDCILDFKAKPKPKLTIYPGVGHDSWTQTYANPKLYKWLLEQKRK